MSHCTACAARITSRNYTKFLVDRNGQPVKRLKPAFDPVELERDVSAPAAPIASLLLRSSPILTDLYRVSSRDSSELYCGGSLFLFLVHHQVQSLLLGNEVLPEECIMHPGRIVCKVDYPDA